MTINYQIITKAEEKPAAVEVADVLRRSGLRRPIDDLPRVERMVTHANLIVCAYADEQIDGGQKSVGQNEGKQDKNAEKTGNGDENQSRTSRLIGIARALTDFSFCCYLSDLAVDVEYQKQGIGRTLIDHVREASGEETQLILLSAPAAHAYYPHIGFEKIDNGWRINRTR